MVIKGGSMRPTIEVGKWPELVCLNDVLGEVAPSARQTRKLSELIDEVGVGGVAEPPFRVAGKVAIAALGQLEELSRSDSTSASLAAEMLSGQSLLVFDRVVRTD